MTGSRRRLRKRWTRSRSVSQLRLGLARRRAENSLTAFSEYYAHTSRFSPAHSLGEEQPADYARDEIRGRGEAATCAGSRIGGASLREGAGARAAFDDGAHPGTAASAARAAGRESGAGDCAYWRARPGGRVQYEHSSQSERILPRESRQKDCDDSGGQEGPGCAEEGGIHICGRVGQRSGARRVQDGARDRQAGDGFVRREESGFGVYHLQRIQERDGTEFDGGEAAAR